MMQLRDLEINCVRNCNLACLSCNHGSAIAEREWMNVDQLARDLGILSEHAHWNLCMIQGGEPTIRKDLDEFMVVIRDSGIADNVGVLTNGTLLHIMPPSFWHTAKVVNLLLRISVYPVLTPIAIQFAQEKCREHGIRLEMGPLTTHFMKMFQRHEDGGQKVWDECPWKRCWTIHNGWLYRCPTSAFFPKQFPEMFEPNTREQVDGWELSKFTHTTMDEILSRTEPLATCAICYGHGTERVPWGQSRDKSEWIAQSTL